MHMCIAGGGSAIAQPIIERYLTDGWSITAICRDNTPVILETPHLRILKGYDLSNNRQASMALRGVDPIDLLITLTGVVLNAKITGMTFYQWENVFSSTLNTVFNTLQHAYHRMTEKSNIIVVGSIVGTTGGYGCSNYASAKSALLGLVRAASNEWAHKGIYINLLELGYTNLGMGTKLPTEIRDKIVSTIPVGHFAEADDIVHAIRFLGSTRYMTGGVLTLAGGLR